MNMNVRGGKLSRVKEEDEYEGRRWKEVGSEYRV